MSSSLALSPGSIEDDLVLADLERESRRNLALRLLHALDQLHLLRLDLVVQLREEVIGQAVDQPLQLGVRQRLELGVRDARPLVVLARVEDAERLLARVVLLLDQPIRLLPEPDRRE